MATETRSGKVTTFLMAARPQLGRLLRWLTPNGGTLLLIALLIATQPLWARPTPAPQAAPNAPGPSATTINYQGRLADSGGNPLTQTGLTVRFAIYDALTGGNLIWPAAGPETHVIDVSDGLFSVGLGSQTAGGIPTSVWDGDRYLQITVGAQALSPRELIRAVPLAQVALTVSDNTLVRTLTSVQANVQYGSFQSNNTCDVMNVTFPYPYSQQPIVILT